MQVDRQQTSLLCQNVLSSDKHWQQTQILLENAPIHEILFLPHLCGLKSKKKKKRKWLRNILILTCCCWPACSSHVCVSVFVRRFQQETAVVVRRVLKSWLRTVRSLVPTLVAPMTKANRIWAGHSLIKKFIWLESIAQRNKAKEEDHFMPR